MSTLEQDVSLDHVFWWNPAPGFSWVDFHQAMDDITDLVTSTQQSVSIIAHPQGELPSGNAIPHINRLLKILKHSSDVHFILVLDGHHPISKMLMLIISRVYGVPDNFVIVQTVDQALAKIQTTG